MVQLAESALAALNWTLEYETGRQKADDSLAVRIGAISGLKTFPVIAQKVISLLSKSDFTIDEITDTIRQDPSLAAGVLRLANSPFYMSTHPITSLDIAFIRLGRNTVREAIFAVATMQMFPDSRGLGRMIRDHCAAVAAISHTLSARLRIGTPEIMFLAGLMHDIGIMLLIDSGEVTYNIGKDTALTDSESLRAIEMEQVLFDHAILGAQVLSRWKVGAPIPQVIAYHHIPELAWQTPEVGSLVALLRIADKVELFLEHQYAERTEFFTELSTSEEGERLHLTNEKLIEIWNELKDSRQNALSLFP
ncbi:MAG: HDOD domain-containing protein [Deltaproteobacteria bacterium]|nr:HDOD domain-containing protein [Deltaproteobacteria bacterium]MBN2670712.1 HDOD domain-containing protein [Deltaproteobacteria bacterium]